MTDTFLPSIQIDPTFPYYQNRSPESIAEELWLSGYASVDLFITNEFAVDRHLVEILREYGLVVWGLTLGNGSFFTSHLPSGFRSWQMELLKPVNDGYTRLSPFSYRYVSWKKEALARLVSKVPFDGLHLAEPYLPEWNGLQSGTYGDVGPLARELFRRRHGAEMPELQDASSPRFYKKQPELYKAWVQFRTEGVNSYLNEIVNGVAGVREARPDIRIATWTLAVDAGPDSADRLVELQGNDAVSMIRAVNPDLHMLQTHWPDWSKAALPPDYVRSYRPYIEAIHREFPELPVGIQNDIGSAKQMIRSRGWQDKFVREVRGLGCRTYTAYEYHLGGALYDEPPRLLRAERRSSEMIALSFHKRISPPSAPERCIAIRAADGGRPFSPERLETDGSRLLLTSHNWPQEPFFIGVSGIADTPELLLFPPAQPNVSSHYEWAPLPAAQT